ncbi:hypothetical protein BD560DRAFT_423418 [Blakeslea trispora]|nr:hypothetical protein BD560DRAFT_423418 [Blakeslea trispora]
MASNISFRFDESLANNKLEIIEFSPNRALTMLAVFKSLIFAVDVNVLIAIIQKRMLKKKARRLCELKWISIYQRETMETKVEKEEAMPFISWALAYERNKKASGFIQKDQVDENQSSLGSIKVLNQIRSNIILILAAYTRPLTQRIEQTKSKEDSTIRHGFSLLDNESERKRNTFRSYCV